MKNLHNSVLKKLSSGFTLLLVSAGLFAQTNFSGTWAFNESKSNFGDSQFRFAATTMVITQDANAISAESTQPGRDGGEVKSTAKYNLDGTVTENPMFNSTRKSTVTWSADKSSIAIASTMKFERDGQSTEMKSSETWKLSEGGKLLLIESTFTGPNGDVKRTIAYDKK